MAIYRLGNFSHRSHQWLQKQPIATHFTRQHLTNAYVTVHVFWKTDHLRTRTDIHVLPVHDRHTHALSRNTKHLTIDSQVCFYKRLFIDAVKPRGCISWPWGASIGLHGTPGCSSRQSWPRNSLCRTLKVQHCSLSLNGCFNPPSASHPPQPPPHPPTPYKLNPWYYRSWKKTSKKPAAFR